MSAWSTWEAENFVRQQSREDAEREAQARADAEAGPCPACGGPAHVDLFEVTFSFDNPAWVPGYKHCVNECWRVDRDRFLAAVRGR